MSGIAAAKLRWVCVKFILSTAVKSLPRCRRLPAASLLRDFVSLTHLTWASGRVEYPGQTRHAISDSL